jgi:adenylyltransferase/sulfurtransferase
MLNKAEKIRYARHIILPEIGEKGQVRLKNAKVLVVGAGGLGCPVLQYLVAAGIGKIGIIDNDVVEESNLQRQVLFSAEDIGKNKAKLAAEKLEKQNPFVQFEIFSERLTHENALSILGDYDIVVDGSDNFPTRYLVNDACVMLVKPLVFGSIFKFEGQVSVFNYQDGPTYRCLYAEPPADGEVPNCAEIGVIGVLPGICGTLMANEVIKIITGVGKVLKGVLLSFDALTMNFDHFQFSLDPKNKHVTLLNDYALACGIVNEISAVDLKKKMERNEDFQLIDVREESEYVQRNIGGVLIPLGALEKNLDRINSSKETIVHCASGARSKKAVQLLREKGFANVYNLRNGLLDF